MIRGLAQPVCSKLAPVVGGVLEEEKARFDSATGANKVSAFGSGPEGMLTRRGGSTFDSSSDVVRFADSAPVITLEIPERQRLESGGAEPGVSPPVAPRCAAPDKRAQPVTLGAGTCAKEAGNQGRSGPGLPESLARPTTTGERAVDPPSSSPENKVVGVICSGNIAADRDQVKDLIARGISQREGAVWVCLEPKSDRITHDVMLTLDIDPVVLPMVKSWKNDSGDWRRTWRDSEMLLCDELIVFHKRAGQSPWRERLASGYHRNLYMVEVGTAPSMKGTTPKFTSQRQATKLESARA